jgi:hypothetical protein
VAAPDGKGRAAVGEHQAERARIVEHHDVGPGQALGGVRARGHVLLPGAVVDRRLGALEPVVELARHLPQIWLAEQHPPLDVQPGVRRERKHGSQQLRHPHAGARGAHVEDSRAPQRGCRGAQALNDLGTDDGRVGAQGAATQRHRLELPAHPVSVRAV